MAQVSVYFIRLTIVALVIGALSLAACGGGAGSSAALPSSPAGPAGGTPSGLIVLNPNSKVANPAIESISSSFVLTASETGYSGLFTAKNIAWSIGPCWVVQTSTSSGTFTIAPTGSICVSNDLPTANGTYPDIEQIQVSDSLGHSTIAYIRGTQSAVSTATPAPSHRWTCRLWHDPCSCSWVVCGKVPASQSDLNLRRHIPSDATTRNHELSILEE